MSFESLVASLLHVMMMTHTSAPDCAFTCSIRLQLVAIVRIVLVIVCGAEGTVLDLIWIASICATRIVGALGVRTTSARVEVVVVVNGTLRHPSRFAPTVTVVVRVAAGHQLLRHIVFAVGVRLRCRWGLLLSTILSNRLLLMLLLIGNWSLSLLIGVWRSLRLLLRLLGFLWIKLKHFLVKSNFLSM